MKYFYRIVFNIYLMFISTYLPAISSDIFLDFSNLHQGWKSGCADYHEEQESIINFKSGIHKIPDVDNKRGYLLAGSNRSDDLFMYIATQLSGLQPNVNYKVDFHDVLFATNAPAKLMGIGGAPGEAVSVKVGASTLIPESIKDNKGFFRMNMDHGYQKNNGKNAIVIGNFAKSSPSKDFNYELKILAASQPLTVSTNSSGELWLFVGTDSGFEGRTEIYFISGHAKLNLLQNAAL